jgi:HAE1 family hydrophobic/amphiphilic exporter-1
MPTRRSVSSTARQTLTITGNAQLMKAADYANLIIAQRNGEPVRLKDVADVQDSFQSTKTAGSYNGERSIVLLVQRQPDANTVQVVDGVRRLLPQFKAQLPASININLVNDRSVSIREAIHDVNLTLLLTVGLVVMVIFLFLRRAAPSFRPSPCRSRCWALALLYAFGLVDNVSAGRGPGGGRRHRGAGKHRAPHRDGQAAAGGALVGAKEMGFTIISISVAGGGVHPDLLHAGRDRPDVP